MKLIPAASCLALGLLAACSSNSEKQSNDAVASFYGGTVQYAKGSHLSTDASEPQGTYRQVTLRNAHLENQYDDLSIPASNCAYLVYSHLPPAERQGFDYLKVTLEDSAATHSYTYRLSELQAFSQAVSTLPVIMSALQRGDYPAAARAFNPAALGLAGVANLPTRLAALGNALGPITGYTLHGCRLLSQPVAGQPQQLVQVLVAVPQQGKTRRLSLLVNPRTGSTGKFLYGLEVLPW